MPDQEARQARRSCFSTGLCFQDRGQFRHRDIWLLLHPSQQKIPVGCQLANAAAALAWSGRASPIPPIYQLDRAAGTDLEMIGSTPS